MNNKDQITLLVAEWKPIILCLVETHVDSNISLRELEISEYKIENCTTTNRRTGGVLIYVKKEYRYKVNLRQNMELYLWILSIEINIMNEKYLICAIYHPPQVNDNLFLEFFENYLENVINFTGTLLIVGDFNFDFKKDTFYSNKMKSMVYKYGLYQLVRLPTRITQHSSTLIDLIITNEKHLVHEVNNTPKISDHCILSIHISTRENNTNKINIHKRSFKNYDIEHFHNMLQNTEWDNNSTNVNYLSDLFTGTIRKILDEMCPIITINIPEKYTHTRWISQNIISKMKERDIKHKIAVFTKSDQDWEEYKNLRNTVVKMIRQEKEKYFNRILDENKNNTRELWKNLKTILPSKRMPIGEAIKFDNIETEDEETIALKFNFYFLKSIDEIVSDIKRSHEIEHTINLIDRKVLFPTFTKIELSELKQIVKSLKNTAGVEDGISVEILKNALAVIGNRLLDVINASLESGIFPSAWKTSVIIPVPKVANTVLCEEFRPINTVPPYEKVLEIAVKNQLLTYCDTNKLIVPNQSGFRKDHSCETVLINICDIWLKAIDNGDIVISVFLDFRRAFETVDRTLLLRKLEKVGICNTVLKWFQSYLCERFQKVTFKNSTSMPLETTYGVPQGTVLGPILFLIYINDMMKCVKDCKICMFADDTMLYIVGKNVNELIQTINLELKNIYEWLCDNSLCINVNKSKFMVIGRKYTLNNIDWNNITIKINQNVIERVNEMKYLGVVIDENLTFKSHATYIMNKMSKKVSFLYRVGDNLSMYTKVILYKAIIAPHLEFCSSVLFLLNKNQIEQLQKIQNRAMRIILKCNRYTPIKMMLNVLNFMNVYQRIVYKTLIFIFKMKNRLLPTYLYDNLKTISEVHNYQTRNRNDFFIDTVNKTSTERSVFLKGLKMYNNLPDSLKNCNKLITFQIKLIDYVTKEF